MGELQIHLVGPLRVICELRGDVTPSGRRAQAIVALLALSPAHARGRAWLQAKLWSDKSAEQASGSLRQELSRLRRAIGEDHIASEFQRVRLVRVGVDVAEMVEAGALHGNFNVGEPLDLLEGLEVNDEEFEEWLRLERAHWHGLIAAASKQACRNTIFTRREDDLSVPGKRTHEKRRNGAKLPPEFPSFLPIRLVRGQDTLQQPVLKEAEHDPGLAVASYGVLAKAAHADNMPSGSGNESLSVELYHKGRVDEEAAPTFAPVIVMPVSSPSMPTKPIPEPRADRIEIVLANGRRIIVGADVDGAVLAHVVVVLERS